MVRWQNNQSLQQKKLLAKTDLLFLYVAVDDRCDTTEEIRDTRDLEFVDHIRTRFFRRDNPRLLQDQKVFRYGRFIEVKKSKDIGKRAFLLFQEFDHHQPHWMTHCLNDLCPDFRFLERNQAPNLLIWTCW